MTLIKNFEGIQKGTAFSICIGVFDGVHIGHQEIIKKAIQIGETERLKTAVLTFEPYPEEVLLKDPPKRLTDLSLKATLIQGLAPDYVIYMRFDEELAKVEPEEFIKSISQHINLRHVVVGANFHFGHRAAGNTGDLKRYGSKYGFTVDIVPLLEKDGITVSSTIIRGMLADRKIEEASALLGRPTIIRGDIVYGAGRGNELGFPTVNLFPFNPGSVPADGVYGGLAHVGDKTYKAAISIGNKPTFNGRKKTIEAHLLDAGETLYGELVDLEIHKFIRGQIKFDSKDALIAQIESDVAAIRGMEFVIT